MSETTGDWRAWADATLDQVDQRVREAQERAAAARRLHARSDQVRGQATSRWGEVTAVTDVSGRLLDLRLDDSALTLGAQGLARLVLDVAEQARTQAATQVLDLARTTFGEGSATVAQITAELSRAPRRPA